ncbi:MAG: FtsX-like permease family protein [Candidatus Thorarchaeota archaeon]
MTRNRLRTSLLIAAIVIAVGLEVGIALTIDTLQSDFSSRSRGTTLTDITVHPKKSTTLQGIRELGTSIEPLNGIQRASPVAIFVIQKNVSNLENITNTIILYGLESSSHPDFSNLQDIDDEVLLPDTSVISFSIAQELGAFPGNILQLPATPELGFNGLNVSVTNYISDRTDFGSYSGFLFVLVDLDYMIGLFSSLDNIDFHIAVEVGDIGAINTVSSEIQDFIGLDYEVFREKQVSETDILAINAYQIGMGLIIIASFLVEFLFVTNILTINVSERAKEFGILQALGSSKQQMIWILGIEVLLIGLLGDTIGHVLGIGFYILSVTFLNLNFRRIQLNLTFNPSLLVLTYLLGMMITIAAGLYPIVFRTLRLPAVQNIHWQSSRRPRKLTYGVFLLLGIFFTALGVVTLQILGPIEFLSLDLFTGHFFVVASIFLGLFLLLTGFLRYLPKVGMKFLRGVNIVPRTIATRNVTRNSQKSTITIMVTGLALTFILIIGIVSNALIDSVPAYYEERFGKIDLLVETRDSSRQPLQFGTDLAANNSDILNASFIQQQRTEIGTKEGYVFGIDPQTFGHFIEDNMILPLNVDIENLLNNTLPGIIMADRLNRRVGGRIGDEIPIKVNESSHFDVTIVGIVVGNPFLQDGEYVFMSSALFQELWNDDSANWFAITLSPDSAGPNIVGSQLLGEYPILREAVPVEFYAQTIRSALTSTSLFLQILIFYSFLLSSLAQFLSTLMSSLMLEREMGILRALGLPFKDALALFSAESFLLGTIGILYGVIGGIVGSELLRWFISFSIPMEITPDPILILFWIVVSFVITNVSARVTTRRTVNTVIAFALNSELPKTMSTKRKSEWEDWTKMYDQYLDERFKE